MYMDGVILVSLVVVVLTCAIVVYLGVYALKHIQKDIQPTLFEGDLSDGSGNKETKD